MKNKKTKQPIKKPKKIKKQLGATGGVVVNLAHAKRRGVRHLKLVEHKHTCRLIQHVHTSYVVLIGVLIIVGLILLTSESISSSLTKPTITTGVTVSLVVPGRAPEEGVTILSPSDGTTTNQRIVDVTGTCEDDMFVVVRDGGRLVGSTMCTGSGTFTMKIQLHSGKNKLSALNYDNLNQVGPDTPSVTVDVVGHSGKAVPTIETDLPSLPINPSIIAGVGAGPSSCDDYQADTIPTDSAEPYAVFVCVPRLLKPDIKQLIGFLVWGGSPPYVLSIDWGDESEPTTLTLPDKGYQTQEFSYALPGIHEIKMELTDKDNQTAVNQTAVYTSSESVVSIASIVKDIMGVEWFKTPVPLYFLAVSITLGFWAGDIFHRNFGTRKRRQRA